MVLPARTQTGQLGRLVHAAFALLSTCPVPVSLASENTTEVSVTHAQLKREEPRRVPSRQDQEAHAPPPHYESEDRATEAQELGEVIVTGSNIRGATSSAAPVSTYSRDAI